MLPTDLHHSDLNTFAFRVDPADLGDVTCYEFGEDFLHEWNDLPSQRGLRRPQFERLTRTLKAMTSQPIRIQSLPTSGRVTTVRLYTTTAIPSSLLRATFATFQQIQRGDSRDNLGDIAHDTAPMSIALAEHVNFGSGPVSMSGQVPVYNITQWAYVNRIAHNSFMVDDVKLVFRPDTEANLVAWGAPVTSRWGKSGIEAIATTYLEPTIVTLPGAADLYLRLEPRLSRVPLHWGKTKHAWVDHGPGKPLLVVPLRRGGRGTPPAYGDDLGRLMESWRASPLPELPVDLAHADTQVLRARAAGSRSHPIGTGIGVRAIHQLQRQLTDLLGVPGPIFKRNPISIGVTYTKPITAADLTAAVQATQSEHLRIVGLYSDPKMRERMLKALLETLELDTTLYLGDDEETSLTDRVSLVFHRAPDIIGHGDQPRDFDSIEALKAASGVAIVCFVETDTAALEPEDEDEADIDDDSARKEVLADAKPQVRKALAGRGIICQFLDRASTPDPSKKRRPKPGLKNSDGTDDHPGENAVVDLFRQAGVLDGRLHAIVTAASRRPLTQAATFVGVYVHHDRRNKHRVVKIAALHASPDPDESWRLDLHEGDGWLPYREAAARYLSGPVGKAKERDNKKDVIDVRTRVEEALQGLPTDRPIVVFVDAEDGSRIWPGMTHPKHGAGLLPGHSLRHPNLAVVRVALTAQSLRPTHRNHGPTNSKDRKRTKDGVTTTIPADPGNPDLPDAYLYEHVESGVSTWLFPRKSRAFKGSGGSTSARTTRWALTPNEDGKPHPEMSKNWHGLGVTEISVPDPAGWEPEDLVLLAARLCQQPVSWDSRTNYPAPLHLAQAVYKDHPDATVKR